MKIDLNNPDEFTEASVAKLIASKDDSLNRQLRVTKEGVAYLSDVVGGEGLADLAFRLETWDARNSYCGPKASRDKEWVRSVYLQLKENWPNPKSDCIDY